MRDYAKVVPKFWTGETGKAIRKRGPEGVVVAMYLMTSPHSNMVGLFYQPLLYMAHETGLGLEGASKGLRICIEEGFCLYDEASEMVWVMEMAKFQIGERLKANDNRCVGIQKEYDALQDNPFLYDFWLRYHPDYHLRDARGYELHEGPSKPLSSQEQEQEQEQEEEQSSLRSDSQPPAEAVDLLPDTPQAATVHPHPGGKTAEIVLAAYHQLLPSCQRIVVLNPKRQRRVLAADKLARQLCRQLGWEYDAAAFWQAYFEQCAADPWLRGDVPNPNNPRWKQNLDVLLAEDRFAQIMDQAVTALGDAA